MKKLLNAAQAAELIGVTEETARRYIRQQMTCIMLPGRDLRVEESEVERWISSTRKAPTAAQGAPRKKRTPRPVLDPDLFEPDGRIRRRRSS